MFISLFDMWFVSTDSICALTRTLVFLGGFFGSQRDRMCFLTLCSLQSLSLPQFFWGKWWHIIKVISIRYMAHLGQLEKNLFCACQGFGGTVAPYHKDLQLVVWLRRP